MARRTFRYIIILLLLCNPVYARETITGFEKSDLVILNEELRRIREDISGNTDTMDAMIPTGVVWMWSGDADSVPSGWHLCDGTDGTPNLVDKFILGADDNTVSVGDTGGANERDLSHTHNIEHHHDIPIGTWSSWTSGGDSYYGYPLDTSQTGASHYADAAIYAQEESNSPGTQTMFQTYESSATNSGTSGSSTQDMRPEYYALAFIIKL